MKDLRQKLLAWLLCLSMLLPMLAGAVPAASAASVTEEVLLNSMDHLEQWTCGGDETVSISAVSAGEHTQGTASLELKATHTRKSDGFGTAIWNPQNLDLTGATKLLMDVFVVEPLGDFSFNVNISNNGQVIYMGSPMKGAVPGQWNTMEIDLTGKDLSNISEIKFWTYGQDMPSDAACTMTCRVDNLRVVRPKQEVLPPQPEVLPPQPEIGPDEELVLLNSMEKPEDWNVENADAVSMNHRLVTNHTEGTGCLEIDGTYQKKDGQFGTMIWNLGALDTTGTRKLVFDVYPVEPLDGHGLGMNISDNGNMIYMGTPMQNLPAGQWTTVEVDLTDKNVTKLTEIKFWIYGGDMPQADPCTMTYRVDNLRIIRSKQEPQPEINTELRLINPMENPDQWRAENTSSVSIGYKQVTEHTEGSGALELTGTYSSKSDDFANLIWNPTGIDFGGTQKLIMDVYPVKPLGSCSFNVNISDSGKTVYMGSPMKNLPADHWSTVEIDLSEKNITNINELKFWMYGQDMPGEELCSMTFRVDNLRIEALVTVPDVVAEPASGTVLQPSQTVELTTKTPVEDCVITYTVDGSDPRTSKTAQTYTAPIAVNPRTELRAVARGKGVAPGAVQKFRYTMGTGTAGETLLGAANFGADRYLPALETAGITVDGKLEEWTGYTGISLPLDKYFPAHPENFSLVAKAAYDAEHLYLGIDVTDDEHIGDYGFGMYGSDCIQMAFSEFGAAYGPEYGFSNVEDKGHIYRWYPGSAIWDQDTIAYKTTRADGHTYYEIALPWQAIFTEKPANDSFYMTLLCGDKDSYGSSGIEWRSGIGSGKVADDFAKVQLIPTESDWGVDLMPKSVAGNTATVDCFLYNLSNEERTFQLSWNGETEAVTVPAGLTLRKNLTCTAAEDGSFALQVTAAFGGKEKKASWTKGTAAEELTPEELEQRRQALENRLGETEQLENSNLVFAVSQKTGSFSLTDRKTGAIWASHAEKEGGGALELTDASGKVRSLSLQQPKSVCKENGTIRAEYAVESGSLTLCYSLTEDQTGIDISFEAQLPEGCSIKSVSLLDHAFWTMETENGYAVVPEDVGRLYKAADSKHFTKVYETYGNYNMAMAGLVKDGSALLVDWKHPDTALSLHHEKVDSPVAAGRELVSVSLRLTGDARSCSVRVLGQGGYVEIAKAYRERAAEKGYLKTFTEKLRDNPQLAKLFGAAMAKPDTMIRGGGTAYTSHTFDQVGQVAAHWHDQLGIEKSLFTLGGWIHKGFDNQYPDILPAAPECGGNEGLAAVSQQIRGYGWLFGLHDNYQDMYPDAPSFDEQYLLFNKDGTPQSGGMWAGGRPYLMASDKAMYFAERNMPQVAELFQPNSYFIDTTFNVPLNISYAPNPLTRSEDLHWKQQLAAMAQQHFGVLGSEGGVEWGVPYGDYFEGILSTRYNSNAGSHTVPLMELVYGDCVMQCAHMGDKLGRYGRNTAKMALVDILYSENPQYQLDDGLYFESDQVLPAVPSVKELKDLGNGSFQITYQWEVMEDVTVDAKTIFTHFTTAPNGFGEAPIIMQEGHDLKTTTSHWKKGDVIEDGPYTVAVPDGRTGKFGILTMLLSQSGSRLPVQGNSDANGRYLLGYVNVGSDGTITFSEGSRLIEDDYDVFSRNDHGYGQYHNLGHQDSMIKNTYEVLTQLNRRTAELEMTSHRFLTADETVEQTEFGSIRIIANFGRTPYEVKPGTVLPQYGFLVEAPDYAAYYATAYEGTDYPDGALFTLRSTDGSALDKASSVEVYHGFGNGPVVWNGETYAVKDRATLTWETEPETPVTPERPDDLASQKPTEPEQNDPFVDVNPDDWFYEDVQYVCDNHLMNGTGDHRFSPQTATTRGMIVTILWRLEQEPESRKELTFQDVPETAYYADAIRWAVEHGIVTGYDAAHFGPEDRITREQLAAILYRYASFRGCSVSNHASLQKFADADTISAYAETAMAWACAEHLIQGRDGGLLVPGGNATRAEAAALLHRFCENIR